MHIQKIPLCIISVLLFTNLTYGAVEHPEPIIPSPSEVFWKKIRPSPYTMVIKSKRYGEFNLTHEADRSLDGYKMLCKRTNYSMEIPSVALVNKKQEIVDLISPPYENIFLLNLDIDKIYECNRDNPSLIEDLKKPSLKPDQRDDIIQRIIANAIYHPLGRLCLVKKGGRIMVLAEVLNQRIFIPLECINIPLHSLIREGSLIRHFPDVSDRSHPLGSIHKARDEQIMRVIYKKIKNLPQGEFLVIEEFPLRKDWYIITTPNTCYWTDYFINYIEIESKKRDIVLTIPIHLHPWHEIRWLLETKEKYWLSEYQIHLIPSGKDIEFFKSRYPSAKLYIIVGRDLYSEELDWAIYDDISIIEKEMHNIELLRDNPVEIKKVLNRIKEIQGVLHRYYTGKGKGLIVDKEIDTLLVLSKRQIVLLSKMEDYKKEYPWRLLNTSFFIPVLNEQLEKKGWKIVSSNKEILGYNLNKKEFYYKEGVTTRMDLFLFILFELCYIETDDLSAGLNREEYTVGVLKDICSGLDYLCIKYYHIEGFAKHMEYLSSIMRHNIWDREKRALIAKEQINNGRYYLDRYNLGYYSGKSEDKISIIADFTSPWIKGGLELEDIVKELSKRHDIMNVEEFSMAFEKQLILRILTYIWQNADFS